MFFFFFGGKIRKPDGVGNSDFLKITHAFIPIHMLCKRPVDYFRQCVPKRFNYKKNRFTWQLFFLKVVKILFRTENTFQNFNSGLQLTGHDHRLGLHQPRKRLPEFLSKIPNDMEWTRGLKTMDTFIPSVRRIYCRDGILQLRIRNHSSEPPPKKNPAIRSCCFHWAIQLMACRW